MKCLVVLAAIAFSGFAFIAAHEPKKPFIEECLAKVAAGKSWENLDKQTQICVAKCVYVKDGIIDEKGKVNVKELQSYLSKPSFKADELKRIEKCAKEAKKKYSTDCCKVVYYAVDCIMKIFTA